MQSRILCAVAMWPLIAICAPPSYRVLRLAAGYKQFVSASRQEWCETCVPACRSPKAEVSVLTTVYLEARDFLQTVREEMEKRGLEWDPDHCERICTHGFRGSMLALAEAEMLGSERPPPSFSQEEVRQAWAMIADLLSSDANPYTCDANDGRPGPRPIRPVPGSRQPLASLYPGGPRVRLKRCVERRLQSPGDQRRTPVDVLRQQGKSNVTRRRTAEANCYVETVLAEGSKTPDSPPSTPRSILIPARDSTTNNDGDGGGGAGGSGGGSGRRTGAATTTTTTTTTTNWLKEITQQAALVEAGARKTLPWRKLQQLARWADCLQTCIGRAARSTPKVMLDTYEGCIASSPQTCGDLSHVFPSIDLREGGRAAVAQYGRRSRALQDQDQQGVLEAAALLVGLVIAAIFASAASVFI
ncbi:MAG: hypothetical protein M1826_004889 [Phylliscum demangeonii]|nr:MAG: hypothetical protein M1826_004889 [Phylliscum demangeonii]